MSDIFISYSRKDSEQALQLAERLRNEGMSVWIDQQGIEAATTWSGEIVDAIEGCKAFLILLSSHSMQSENVAKELSIASENKCKLLPVAIEDIPLARDFKYPLAGIQRVAYTQHDAITQALVSCGIIAVKTTAKKKDARKSLLVMPFEDLSPTQDNLWFADGLAGELIDKLSHIKSLKLIDRKTSRDLRTTKLSMYEIAETLEVQYVIEGSVRKFGDQIKISTSLLDVTEGEYLWQDSHKGVMADIFEMQELVADKVVAGLKLHLGSEEKNEIGKKLTENAEAYEFYLKGLEEFSRYTQAGFERALAMYGEATRLDPDFAAARSGLAIAHLQIYRIYDRNRLHLEAAARAIEEVRRIEGESKLWCWGMSHFHYTKAAYGEAERCARRSLEIDGEFAHGYAALGQILHAQNRLEEAVDALRELVKRRPNTSAYLQLLISLNELGDMEGLQSTAQEALPVYEKHLKLNPEDLNAAVNYLYVFRCAGKWDEARLRASELMQRQEIEGIGLYNLACLFCSLDEKVQALEALRRAIARGYSEIELLRRDPDLNPIRDMPEFKAILANLEASIAAQQTSPNEDKPA